MRSSAPLGRTSPPSRCSTTTVTTLATSSFWHTPRVFNLERYVGDWGGGFPRCEVCGVDTDQVWVGEYRFSGGAYRTYRCECHDPTNVSKWPMTGHKITWQEADELLGG